MTEESATPDRPAAGADHAGRRRRAARERQRHRVFGDVLDDATVDDRPEPAAGTEADSWLRDNVPPHHGD